MLNIEQVWGKLTKSLNYLQQNVIGKMAQEVEGNNRGQKLLLKCVIVLLVAIGIVGIIIVKK